MNENTAEKLETEEQVAPELEVEVVDDTPEEDQNRKNLPKELVQKLESDELDDYDDKVKDKIYQLKKVWHDERREKERIQRENAEAIKAAQKLREENKLEGLQLYINPDMCIDCGACIPECPPDAIFETEDDCIDEEGNDESVRKNYEFFDLEWEG